MATPFITSFGDDSHEVGEAGLTITGFNFGLFPGEVWLFANADRSGASDQLAGFTWGETSITGVDMPAAPNNAEGTVYLAVMTQDFEWSSPAFPYAFTLGAAPPAPAAAPAQKKGGKASRSVYPRRIMIFGKRYTVRSAYEERTLLAKLQAEEEAKLKTEPKQPEVIRYRMKRVSNRIQKVDNGDAYRNLRHKWDEELLAFLAG